MKYSLSKTVRSGLEREVQDLNIEMRDGYVLADLHLQWAVIHAKSRGYRVVYNNGKNLAAVADIIELSAGKLGVTKGRVLLPNAALLLNNVLPENLAYLYLDRPLMYVGDPKRAFIGSITLQSALREDNGAGLSLIGRDSIPSMRERTYTAEIINAEGLDL
jgi:hypothetical protein